MPSDKKSLVDRCRHFVLDMDGTFYLGDTILGRSMEFLRRVKETGRDFIFFTNNSSKSPKAYIDKLSRMGVAITPREIMTSGDVMVEFLQANYPKGRVYLLGTPALTEQFREAGIHLVEQDADIVVVGFDQTLTYEKLVKACDFIRHGAVYLATHLDINCPVEGGFIPDVGSFCALIDLSVGGGVHPRVTGKPHRETVDMVVRRTGWMREEIAFVGDRIYTDVATGVDNGAIGLLVLSGEADMQTVRESKTKPDGIFQDLGEISDYF